MIGEAGDIQAAKELVQDLRPDLAIVDVMLPGENGVTGVPQLKALARNLRVILISAEQDRAQLLQKSAAEAGAEAFLLKDDLELAVVRQWLETSGK